MYYLGQINLTIFSFMFSPYHFSLFNIANLLIFVFFFSQYFSPVLKLQTSTAVSCGQIGYSESLR